MQMEITLAKMIESRRFLTLMRCIKLFNAGKRSTQHIKEQQLTETPCNKTLNRTAKSKHYTNQLIFRGLLGGGGEGGST